MTAHDEAEYDGMDALMAALLDEPLPEEARRDPAFLAGHAAAVADLAVLREQLTAIGDALAGPGEAAPSGRHTAAHPGKRPATDPGPARTTGPHPPASPEPGNPTTPPVPLSSPPARPGTGQEPGAIPQPVVDRRPVTPPHPRGGPETGGAPGVGEGLEPVVGEGAGTSPGLRGGPETGDVAGVGGPEAGDGLEPRVGEGAGTSPGPRVGTATGGVPGNPRRVGGHGSRGPYRGRRRVGKAVLGGLVAAAAAGFVLGMGWLVSQGAVGGADDSAGSKAAADAKDGGGVAFGGPRYLACARLVAEGSVAAVEQVPGAPAGTERVTVRVSRYYKGEGEEVTFLQDVVEATPLSPGDRVLVGMPLDGDRPDAVIVGEAEIARERARILASLPASRSLTCG